MEPIQLESTFATTRELLTSDLDGEAVILHPKSGMYYGLDDLGTRIWSLIRQSLTVNEMRDQLVEEFDVDAAKCEEDLMVFLKELADQGLVEVLAAS